MENRSFDKFAEVPFLYPCGEHIGMFMQCTRRRLWSNLLDSKSSTCLLCFSSCSQLLVAYVACFSCSRISFRKRWPMHLRSLPLERWAQVSLAAFPRCLVWSTSVRHEKLRDSHITIYEEVPNWESQINFFVNPQPVCFESWRFERVHLTWQRTKLLTFQKQSLILTYCLA